MTYVYSIVGTILTLDAIGFIAWVASGQVPPDSFYLGTLTAHMVSLAL